ncbi:PchX [Methylocaldum marinum]|uniref:PchX n=1 Tax=Methylocaldum marinum TaxID=1432792 RepID=A0A250KLQ4_9GAMM|nr:twin-arginine translocation signal domain-containing protein [Methylocaldum marinum]BBA32545.1 PchX [Methylocaldum marinum]
MEVDRRQFLKGMALTGLAGAFLNPPRFAMADTDRRSARQTLALVNGAAEHSAFVHGIHAANPAGLTVRGAGLGLDFLRRLKDMLESGQASWVIGLVDDASGTLIVELARAAGARLQWLAQHAVDAGQSRHRVLGGALAHSCAVQLGEQLNACGENFNLSEQRVDGRAPLRLAAGSRAGNRNGGWAATLGFVLAAPGAVAPRFGTALPPLTGHFVSFSIET